MKSKNYLTYVCGSFLLLLSLTVMNKAFADIQPSFYLSFDKGFSGQGFAGAVDAKFTGFVQLVPGKYGNALKIGPLSGHLEYPSAGILNPAEGTVEMWVKPVDWQPSDDKFHVFFDVRGGGALHLYKYYQNSELLMLSTNDRVNGPYYSSGREINWQAGTWHHLAGSWSERGVLLYVDGVPVSGQPVESKLPTFFDPYFSIGDMAWDRLRLSTSLVDEVRIYNRELTPRQIAMHYENRFGEELPVNAETISVYSDIHPRNKTIFIKVRNDTPSKNDDLSLRFAIVRPGSNLTEDAKAYTFNKQGEFETTLPLPTDSARIYQLLVLGFYKDKKISTIRRELIIPNIEWYKKKKVEPKTPRPWTDPKLSKDTVSVWGRDYQFSNSALPTQIITLGNKLLAAPISLQAVIGGKSTNFLSSRVDVVKGKNATDFEISQRLQSVSSTAKIKINVSTKVAFDGLTTIDLFAENPAEIEAIDRLVLDVPISLERASYRHKWAATGFAKTGLLPIGTGVIDNSEFIPFYWIGDNDIGLFWFAETGAMWPNAENYNAIEVVRDNNAVHLKINIKMPGQRFPNNWRMRVGLQATPVKPLPKDWRKWRVAPAANATVDIIWPTPTADSMKYYGYPEAREPNRFWARIKKLRAKDVEPIPYGCLTYLSTASPEWPFFKDQWSTGNLQATPADVRSYGASFAMVSPRGKGWQEFIAWKTDKFIKDYKLRGLYYDNTQPLGAFAPNAGLGYVKNGKRQLEHPILAYRQLYQTLYGLFQGANEKTFLIAHSSGNVTIPMLAFVDAYLEGEQFRGVVKDNYMDVISLDRFRAEFMGRQWGLIPIFLPEFSTEIAKEKQPTRGLMALLMLHDVAPWPLFSNVDEVNKALSALDKFDYADATFYPYFGSILPAKTTMNDIYISAYKKDAGRWLLVVGNLSRQDRKGNVCIDKRIMGNIQQVISWPDGESLPMTPDSCIGTSLKGMDYQLLRLSIQSPGGRAGVGKSPALEKTGHIGRGDKS